MEFDWWSQKPTVTLVNSTSSSQIRFKAGLYLNDEDGGGKKELTACQAAN